jgi:hypothetical protein
MLDRQTRERNMSDSTLFPRRCDDCGKGMREGYVFGDCETYCDDCAFESPAERAAWEATYTEDGDSYWTEWTELDLDEAYTADGQAVEPCAGCAFESPAD